MCDSEHGETAEEGKANGWWELKIPESFLFVDNYMIPDPITVSRPTRP